MSQCDTKDLGLEAITQIIAILNFVACIGIAIADFYSFQEKDWVGVSLLSVVLILCSCLFIHVIQSLLGRKGFLS